MQREKKSESKLRRMRDIKENGKQWKGTERNRVQAKTLRLSGIEKGAFDKKSRAEIKSPHVMGEAIFPVQGIERVIIGGELVSDKKRDHGRGLVTLSKKKH